MSNVIALEVAEAELQDAYVGQTGRAAPWTTENDNGHLPTKVHFMWDAVEEPSSDSHSSSMRWVKSKEPQHQPSLSNG